MFEKETERYEGLRRDYQRLVVQPMGEEQYREYNEILFSTHSCAIEGNTFTLADSRALFELGLGMTPQGRSLLECTEMADHFRAFEFMLKSVSSPFDEALAKETNRLVTLHTLAHKVPGAVPGEYTTVDMAAGDTLFGDHRKLIARLPELMKSTDKALSSGTHPLLVAARFHGFFIYLHPFRDGNGRTARLLSNHILLKAGHPLLIIESNERNSYIDALRCIRTEGTDEYLTAFFLRTAIKRMEREIDEKRRASRPVLFF